MKINPIIGSVNTNQNRISRQQSNLTTISQNTTVPQWFGNYGRAAVNFRALPPADIVRKIKDTKFEDKLAYAMYFKMENRDMLVAAKTPQMAYDSLKKIISEFPVPLERLFVLIERKLEQALTFTNIPRSDSRRIWNLNDSPILINGMEVLPPETSRPINVGDHIRIPSGWMEIKPVPEADVDLEKYSSLFLKEINYLENAQSLAGTHNKKMIEEIISDTKEKELSNKNKISFASVGGQDENIDALKKNILFPLKYPEVFDGFMVSRGAILYGLPGTGKSLLAQALVSEAGASAFEMSATEFAAKYVGESEQNCRNLFEKAVDAQPSIIFLDEIEALGKSRGEDVHGDKLLNQFLASMSELEKRGDQVFIIGATNRKEDLDPAFLRSGRFDLVLEVKPPDLKGTRQILDIKVKGKPLDRSVDLDEISKKMHAKKMTGADITSTVKNAHVHALERSGIYESMNSGRFSMLEMDNFSITAEDFENAISNFGIGKNKEYSPVGFKK